MAIKTAVKEWSGVIAALGSGKQILMVRKYAPPVPQLLLYPTFSYCNSYPANPNEFEQKVQPAFKELALKSGEETRKKAQEQCLVDIEYYIQLENCIQISDKALWKKLSPFYIWSPEHVIDYATGAKKDPCSLWLLRVFKLPKVVEIGRFSQGGPPNFYYHHELIDTSRSKPVLSDAEFSAKQNAILTIISH